LGAITYGQSKDLLIPLAPEALVDNKFSLIYDTLHEKRKRIEFVVNKNPEPNVIQRIDQQKFRLQLVHCVRSVFEAKRLNEKNPAKGKPEVERTLQQLRALEEEFKQYAVNHDEYIDDLQADLTGQVEEAISRDDWFKKWGVHFLPSLTRKFHFDNYDNTKIDDF